MMDAIARIDHAATIVPRRVTGTHRTGLAALLRSSAAPSVARKSNHLSRQYRFETQPDARRAGGNVRENLRARLWRRSRRAELGAVPLAAATSMACGKPFVIIRNQKKDYGTSKLIEGVLEQGDTVLLVEDVVTSGGRSARRGQVP